MKIIINGQLVLIGTPEELARFAKLNNEEGLNIEAKVKDRLFKEVLSKSNNVLDELAKEIEKLAKPRSDYK